jgi:hypothetical protein
MCPRLFVLAGILPGCWQETYMPTCTEPVYTELADDEVSPLGMSANDLLAIATPGWEGIGHDVDDAEVDAAWAFERGDGTAVFADIEKTDVLVRRRVGFGGVGSVGLYVQCDDWLEVPARLSIVSEAATIDHDMDAVLTSTQPFWDEQRVQIAATEPYEDSGVVVPGIDDSFDTQTIDALLSKGADGRSDGTFSWNGVTDTQARAIYLLMWNDYVAAE